jgi:hypothetical protein
MLLKTSFTLTVYPAVANVFATADVPASYCCPGS